MALYNFYIYIIQSIIEKAVTDKFT